MASRIAGITIEIGGDTSSLQKSLKGVDSQLKQTQNALKDVNKLLKLDPTNTDLLKQKQQLLRDAVTQTQERLEKLKEAQAQMDAAGVDKNSAQYQALQREIAATEQELKNAKKAADSFHPALEKVKASAQKAADGLKSAAEKTRGFSTAAAGVLTALGGLGVKALTTADDLTTMAQRTGLSTDELQRFAYASDRVDVSVESITGALKKLKAKIDPNNESLQKLGVSATNADGSLRDANEVFYDVLEALSKIENETERDQIAMELFGKSADDLAGIIDDGGAALKAYGDEAERAGAIMDEETIASLNAMNDEVDRLKAQGMATLIQTGAKALQALSPVLEQVAAAIGKVFEWIASLSPETLQLIITIAAIVAAIAPLLTMLSGLASGIAFLASPIGIAIAAIAALVAGGVLLYKNWDKVKAVAEDVGNRIKTSWENVKNEVSSAIDALKRTFDSLKEKVVNVWDTIKGILTGQISLPHIPLPHFSVQPPGWRIGDLLQGVMPSLGIDWYRKAYDNPVMFTRPTVMATPGGLKGFGDGSGAEIVMGLDKLREVVGNSGNAPLYITTQVVLDGRVVGESVTKYQRDQARARG